MFVKKVKARHEKQVTRGGLSDHKQYCTGSHEANKATDALCSQPEKDLINPKGHFTSSIEFCQSSHTI